MLLLLIAFVVISLSRIVVNVFRMAKSEKDTLTYNDYHGFVRAYTSTLIFGLIVDGILFGLFKLLTSRLVLILLAVFLTQMVFLVLFFMLLEVAQGSAVTYEE